MKMLMVQVFGGYCFHNLLENLHQCLVLFLAITTPLFPTHRFVFKKHDLSSWSLFEWWILVWR